jgi:hypothetical protein
MIGLTLENQGKVKLLDFGLSQIFADDISSKQLYQKIFSSRDKKEQNGSNVEKLRELCTAFIKLSNC